MYIDLFLLTCRIRSEKKKTQRFTSNHSFRLNSTNPCLSCNHFDPCARFDSICHFDIRDTSKISRRLTKIKHEFDHIHNAQSTQMTQNANNTKFQEVTHYIISFSIIPIGSLHTTPLSTNHSNSSRQRKVM
jgi:hypothetical protein